MPLRSPLELRLDARANWGKEIKKMDIALPEIIATLHFYELKPGEFFRFYRA
jgi:hypothetical protein